MPDQDWTKPKPVGEFYTNPYDKDSDRITVTRGYIMWVMHEAARLSAMVQTVELQNEELKADKERSTAQYNSIIDQQLSEIENLKSDLQMEKDNEDRLVRQWQKANNEVYGLNAQVAALIDEQTRLKAENERLRKAGDAMAKNYFDMYWSLHAESTSRHEPASITNWEEAKENR